jgi:hypothetical protein
MVTVFKYPLELVDEQHVEMPTGSELLTVQVQHDTPMLWARVDTTRPAEQRLIRLAGTGNPNAVGVYVATVQLLGGSLVLHAFAG